VLDRISQIRQKKKVKKKRENGSGKKVQVKRREGGAGQNGTKKIKNEPLFDLKDTSNPPRKGRRTEEKHFTTKPEIKMVGGGRQREKKKEPKTEQTVGTKHERCSEKG